MVDSLVERMIVCLNVGTCANQSLMYMPYVVTNGIKGNLPSGNNLLESGACSMDRVSQWGTRNLRFPLTRCVAALLMQSSRPAT